MNYLEFKALSKALYHPTLKSILSKLFDPLNIEQKLKKPPETIMSKYERSLNFTWKKKDSTNDNNVRLDIYRRADFSDIREPLKEAEKLLSETVKDPENWELVGMRCD